MERLKILRPKELAEMLSISIPTLYRLSKDPEFPKKISLTNRGRSVGWLYSDIEEYLNKQTMKDK